MSSSWRVSAWNGAAIGVVAAGALAWLLAEGQQAMRSAFSSLRGPEALVGALWLFLALGAILMVVVYGAQFHPLISAVPAAWFLIVFGPFLVGVLGTPDWYPEWVRLYLFESGMEAGTVMTGVLVAGTVAAYIRRSRSSPVPGSIEVEEAHL